MLGTLDRCPCRFGLLVVGLTGLALLLLATTGAATAPGPMPGSSGPDPVGELGAQAQVVAECTVSERYPEPGESVVIDASRSRAADQYSYDRNSDGGYDTGWINDSTYSFSYEVGTYTPRVAVRNTTQNRGNIDVASCPTIEVAPNEPPAVSAVVDPETPSVGQQVTIDATGSSDPDGNVTSYQFDFGADGTYEIQDNTTGLATRTYSTAGVKVVRVLAIDNDGAESAFTFEFTVVDNKPPDAAFTISPSPATTTATDTTLNATASADPDGTIEYYLWDFDGDGDVDRNTTDPVITRQFEYQGGGYGNVGLTVVDDAGATDFTAQDLQVSPKPEIRCSVSPRTIEPGGNVTIDVSDSLHADAYEYDFDGDGTMDTDLFSVDVINSGEFGDDFFPEAGTYTPRVRGYNFSADTSTVADCPSVTVEGANEPPEASFTISPRPAVSGQTTTLDASGSSDPDGTIDYYRWDFDNDGTVDRNTTDPVTTRPFQYQGSGFRNVVLTIVDDEGATDTTTRDLEIVQPEVTARCSVSPETLVVGESVTIHASESTNAETFIFDIDGDGEFDTDRTGQATITRQLQESGMYLPRVRVFGPGGERTDTAPCGEIVVEGDNEPPVPSLGHDPMSPTTGESVTLNASDSFDTDGRIVTYRWDLDDDGTFERNTSGPVTNHSFESTGDHVVGVQVQDDDGATASTRLQVTVQAGDPMIPLPVPWWGIAGLVGGAAGFLACRGGGAAFRHLPKPWGGGGGEGAGIAAQATGTFDTPPGGGVITVSGLGFEPDVVRFRVTNGARAAGTGRRSRSAGWSYGVAARTAQGLAQHVVSVADDADSTAGMAGAVNQGKAIDVLVHGEDRVASVAGTVTETTEDGFEMTFDADALPAAAADESYVVLFDAMALPSEDVVDIGHVTTPTEPGTEQVDLDIDADFVSLVGSTLPDTINAAGVTDRSVALSTGRGSVRGASRQAVGQTAAGYVASASLGWPEAAGVFDDRALALAYADGDGIVGRTHARITNLGETLELTYDEVYTPETGDEGWVVPAVVTYIAIDTAGKPPATGVLQPRADNAVATVDVGFRPGRVELATFEHAGLGTEEQRPAGAAAFEWSESTVAPNGDGQLAAYLLHASVDDGLPLVEALVPPEPLPEDTSASMAGTGLVAGSAGAASLRTPAGQDVDAAIHGDTDSGDAGEPAERTAPPDADTTDETGADPSSASESDEYSETAEGPSQVRAGVGLREAPAGGLTGRTEVAVTAMTRMGMELRVTGGAAATADRPLVTYVAWPDPDGGSDG